MIEITCTKREKATIINTLADVKAPCLFPQRDCYDGDNYKCKECSRADSDELAGTSAKECGGAVPA